MRKYVYLALVLSVVCGVYVWFQVFEASTASYELIRQIPVTKRVPPATLEKSEVPLEQPKENLKAKLQSSTTPLELIKKTPPLQDLIPKLDDVRAEVEQNPHVTPPSLIQFSKELARKMKLALQSEEASLYFMNELDQCAAGRVATTSSASATCIQDAYSLSKKYTSLQSKAEDIESHAEPGAQKLFSDGKAMGL